MADELVDIYDINNNPTGRREMKSVAHRDALWHRSVGIWAIDEKRRVLMQKRCKSKVMGGEKWDIAASGHVSAGEREIDAAIKELREETGIIVKVEDVNILGIMRMAQDPIPTFRDREFGYFYFVKVSSNSKLKMQKEEVAELRWFEIPELESKFIENKEIFCSDSHIAEWTWMLNYIKSQG